MRIFIFKSDTNAELRAHFREDPYDRRLPGFEGQTGEHPRVIMVTAKTASRDHDRALELGADDFVTKPFEPNDLLERMRRVLPVDGDQPARPSR